MPQAPSRFPQDAELPGFSRSRLAMWLWLARPNGLGIECEAEHSPWLCFDFVWAREGILEGRCVYLFACALCGDSYFSKSGSRVAGVCRIVSGVYSFI